MNYDESDTLTDALDDHVFDWVSHALKLEVLHSPDSRHIGSVTALPPTGSLVIGRGVRSGLEIDDQRMSRAHLRIAWDGAANGYRYTDLGSTNGSFVNGLPSSFGLLCEEDVLRIGNTLFGCYRELAVRRLDDCARRVGPCALPVLVLGETGTGKEVLARSLHVRSGRRGQFVAVNCAALPKDLAAAELFGHTRGAFSGAGSAREGLFRAAEGGTLLLDEIGDMPRELQPALLRALQEQRIRPVGSDTELSVDVRVIAATHVDLESSVQNGSFRDDLFARLAQVVLEVPPLRRRRSEILALARRFAPELRFMPAAAEALAIAEWPRNVRELRAVVDSLALFAPEWPLIRVEDLAARLPLAAERVSRRSVPLRKEQPTNGQRQALVALMNKHGGNVSAVARELTKPRSQVYRWLERWGLTKGSFRASEPASPALTDFPVQDS